MANFFILTFSDSEVKRQNRKKTMETKIFNVEIQGNKITRITPLNQNVQTNFNGTQNNKKSQQDTYESTVKHPIRLDQKNYKPVKVICALLAALGITTAYHDIAQGSNKEPIIDPSTSTSTQVGSDSEETNIIKTSNGDVEIEIPEENSEQSEIDTKEAKLAEEPEIKEPTLEEKALQIIENDEEVKESYENLLGALNTLSEEIGEDALPLLKSRIEELGEGKVNLHDLVKILYIESGGHIYDEDGGLLKSSSQATGPFQIRPIGEKDLNNRFNLNLDINNPYDNIDAAIIYLRFLHDQKQQQLSEGAILPTGDNLTHAILWGYNAGAWADGLSEQTINYLAEFDKLSIVDKYPEVAAYLYREEI